jgi:cell division septation protein DedD
MLRRQAGASTAGILAVGIFLAVMGVGGYILGRDVIGEQYLKPRASPVSSQGAVSEPKPMESAPKSPPLLGSDPFSFLGKPKQPSDRPATSPEPRPGGGSGSPLDQASKPSGPRRYTIQVGVYLDEQNSRLLQEDLRNRGYSSRVSKGEASGRTVHKVQMGTYSSQEDAQRMADELRAQGYRVNVIPQG